MGRKKFVFWKIAVTPALDEAVERAIEFNAHVSKSDLIREAVREKLKEMGFLEIKQAEQQKEVLEIS